MSITLKLLIFANKKIIHLCPSNCSKKINNYEYNLTSAGYTFLTFTVALCINLFYLIHKIIFNVLLACTKMPNMFKLWWAWLHKEHMLY